MPKVGRSGIFAILFGMLGVGGLTVAGVNAAKKKPTPVVIAPAEPAAPAPTTPTIPSTPSTPPVVEPAAPTSVTFTGTECQVVLDTFCPKLKGAWSSASAWCETQKSAWVAAGVAAVNPCANSKYANDSCVEYNLLVRAADVEQLAPSCNEYAAALNQSSKDVQTHCLYTTKPGGVCAGIKPAPADPNSTTKVVPLDDCLWTNYAVLTATCQDAVDYHRSVSKSADR